MWINKSPYWLSHQGVLSVEKAKNATHMGYWCAKTQSGSWGEEPIDVFYQPNPDVSKGHSHYFGLFAQFGIMYIAKADSCFSKPILGALIEDTGEVLVSRYRHHFEARGPVFVDGGRDYFRHSVPIVEVEVSVNGPEFEFKLVEKENKNEALSVVSGESRS